MRRGALALMLLLATAVPAAAQVAGRGDMTATQAARLFTAGNELYRDADFEAAADHYRRILDAGVASAPVHYNLGNALYRLNKIGPAILQYEKALKLAPGDADIAENLAFMKTLTADRTTAATAGATGFSMVERALGITSLDQDAAILTGLWVATCCLAAAAIALAGRWRRLALWGIGVLALPVMLAAGTFCWKMWQEATIEHGVVLSERVDVRSGPGDDNTSLFTIHEGITVRVLRVQGSWAWISIESGLNGWIPSDTFGTV